ncbi:MAG: class I SAM-dependent methyltransferase [Lunatimonas sp.]|uniref:O-methyltransferase n=1 Tax=Lunatimonas sp. TaxID=2060141 RepID=UPI00263B16B9|nr:class I SAM-dependent methyltransferase [Lunatimonas sp.]MCC5937668.1 class I SAM-dependent methyltransferase [Lunatimonas sp.]
MIRIDHYSIQSPEAYRIYQFLREHRRTNSQGIPVIEEVRRKHLGDNHFLEIVDYGAGSKRMVSNSRRVGQVARVSSSRLSYNLLYQGLCSLTPANTVIELGTCLGITTAYLAQVTSGRVFSFEASDALLQIARRTVAAYPNVTLVPGNADFTLPEALGSFSSVDFCLLDANHTYDATVRYAEAVWPLLHEQSVLVIGDIHWSKEMNKAWNEIRRLPGVTLTMDFFECGVLFFSKGLSGENLVLYYPG